METKRNSEIASWDIHRIMLFKLFVFFSTITLIELYFLILLLDQTALLTTLLLVFLTAIAGAWLARLAGFHVLAAIQEDMRMGRPPADPLIEGAIVLAAGALLLTPGVLTDLVGLVALTPWGRRGIRVWLKRKFLKMAQKGSATIQVHWRQENHPFE